MARLLASVFRHLPLSRSAKNRLKDLFHGVYLRTEKQSEHVNLRQKENQAVPVHPIKRSVETHLVEVTPGVNDGISGAGQLVPPTLYTGTDSPGPPQINVFRSFSEYVETQESRLGQRRLRCDFESRLLPEAEGPFEFHGYCSVCRTPKSFSADYLYAYERDEDGQLIPNWRETLVCETCGMNNRVRAAVDLLMNQLAVNLDDKFYVTEQLTPFYAWMRGVFPHVEGSEFLGSGKVPGGIYDGLRHEDITKLSFDDDSLDCILSFDVLEHVPDTASSLAEMMRCLRPGGFAVISAPFASNQYETIVRARLTEKGEVEHIMEPEYHGNPTRPDEGSLCFYHFGWDLLDQLKLAGASEAAVLSYYSSERANLGPDQLYFIALK